MTEKEYRSAPGISRSQLWKLHDSSPEKFKWTMEHPEEPTPALIFGQAVHKLLLEPDGFDEAFIVNPGFDRRTKEGKAAYSAFCAAKGDRTEIDPAAYETIKAMIEKFKADPLVSWVLNPRIPSWVERERPFFWTDEYTGEKCKCRCDVLLKSPDDPGAIIVDYKSAQSANSDIFNREIFRRGYHVQAAMYAAGVKAALNLSETPQFVFVVQEKTPPYALNVIETPQEVMTYGQDVFRELLGQYHECKETGYWYGYCGPFETPNAAYLPGWLQIGTDENEE